MGKYVPDHWVVLEFDHDGDVIKKVFAGWGGGYLYGQSWKLSSGVTNQREFEDRFEFENESGSLYVCRKSSYGVSGYMTGIFSSFENQVKEAVESGTKVSMKVLKEYETEIR